MAQFHALVVADVKRETPDAVSVKLQIPASLVQAFRFKPGQYLTFRIPGQNGKDVRRSYSLCSSPHADQEWRIAVKKVAGGVGSSFFNEQVKAGDTLEVMEPAGNFVPDLSAAHRKTYHLFAGGSGITPMLSILQSVLHEEPGSNLHLYYGNRDRKSIIFFDDLQRIEKAYPGRIAIHFISEHTHPEAEITGLMTQATNRLLLEKYCSRDQESEFFICGPTPMMDAVKAALSDFGTDASSIHIEYFVAPPAAPAATQNTGEGIDCKAIIILDGDEVAVTIPAGKSVLEAALDAGLDAPFACQGGSCCTCRAKLSQGKVTMKANYALLEKEVKEGFILTCQSYPETAEIIVDYDKGV